MTLVDTNVLLRYLVEDDKAQATLASDFIDGRCSEADPAIVTHVVLAELVWSLGTRYRFDKAEILSALDALAQNQNVKFDGEEQVFLAIHAYRNTAADLADCLIAARAVALGSEPVVTFDRKAARLPQFQFLQAGP